MTTITPAKSKSLLSYLKRHRIPAFILLAYISIIGSLSAIRFITGIYVDQLTKDPLTIARQPFYIGMFSNIGILLWCAAAAICLFTGSLLKKSSHNSRASFFFSSGMITSMLLLDDLFLIHEEVMPGYMHVKEELVYLFYLILICVYLVKFRKIIAKTYLIPLQMAGVFFALSIGCDILPIKMPSGQIEVLLEDSLKLTGILAWSVYYTLAAKAQLKATMETQVTNV